MTPFASREAARWIHQGKVIAYPTEAVYGLGCDPLNPDAVFKLLEIKQRPVHKGLILIAANLEQLLPFIHLPEQASLKPALQTWPGPYTWLIPVNRDTPYWLTGDHNSIAVRITNHPVARQICLSTDSALVSTSANRAAQSPARTALECQLKVPEADLIINGKVNSNAKPSTITDLLTGNVIRTG